MAKAKYDTRTILLLALVIIVVCIAAFYLASNTGISTSTQEVQEPVEGDSATAEVTLTVVDSNSGGESSGT